MLDGRYLVVVDEGGGVPGGKLQTVDMLQQDTLHLGILRKPLDDGELRRPFPCALRDALPRKIVIHATAASTTCTCAKRD